MRESAAAVIGMFIWFAIGIAVGDYNADASLRKQAFERGFMVQCVGKAGYFWECEE